MCAGSVPEGTQRKVEEVAENLRGERRDDMYHHHHFFTVTISFLLLPFLSEADVGTAAYYNSPYLPTTCYGSNPAQFPAGNLFAAAGEGIWDNNAACGRQYQVRCLSSASPSGCISSATIQVKIVDRASSLSSTSAGGTTMVLSREAYTKIANPSASKINIDFAQV